MDDHPSVRAVRARTAAPGAPPSVDAEWLRDLALQAGADDAGVAMRRPTLTGAATVTTRAPRIPYRDSRPALHAMGQLHRAVNGSVLDQTIVELVRVRVSQLNGCAYCIDVHSRDAVAAGESHRRLLLLSGWREADDLFTPPEQAALAAAEGITLLAHAPLPGAVIDALDDHFTVDEQVALLYAIAETNAWNRLAVAAHTPLDDDK